MRNTCQHSQQTRRWPNAGPPSRTLAKHQTSTGSTPRVCWELRSAGLVLLNTAGDDYKPTPIQCLLNVGPASPVLASIYSVLVSTLCHLHIFCLFLNFFFFLQMSYIYIYTFTVHAIYSTGPKKTRQYVRGLAKIKQFQTFKNNLDRAHNTHSPHYPFFLLISDMDSILTVFNTPIFFNFFMFSNFLFSIQNVPEPTHHPNWMFGIFFNFATSLRHDKNSKKNKNMLCEVFLRGYYLVS